MGELKTRFMRGDRYGIRVVAWQVAGLLHDLHGRTSSFDGVWTEALDNAVWDDLVIKRDADTTRWQVKRQTTSMEAKDLKPIIVGVQDILGSAPPGARNLFHIAFRDLVSVHVPKTKGSRCAAKDLELSHLQQLCTDADAPGMQAGALVADNSVPYSDWWPELQSWLGTSDPTKLQEILSRIRVTQLGDEAHLEGLANNLLTPFYEHPDQVLSALITFFTDYSDGRIKVTPHGLAKHVLASHATRTGSALWFDLGLSPTGTRWELRGPRLLDKIASHTWLDTSAVDLTLSSPPTKKDGVTSQLTRLLLHGNNTTTIRASASTQWAAHATQSCFGTLGTDHSSLCNISTAAPCVASFSPIESFLPQELADRLAKEMNDLVWSSMTTTLVRRSNDLSIEPSLRAAVLQRWDAWYMLLSNNTELQFEFTARLAATEAELAHPQFERLARSGQHLVRNAADACLLAAAVAEAFQPGGIDVKPELTGASSNLLLGDIPAHLIAVSHALDRRGNDYCSLSSAPYLALSVEPSILLLGGVSQESEILRRFWEEDASLFSDVLPATTALDKSGAVLPLITLSESLKRALQGGLQSLQKHLQALLSPIVADEYLALNNAIRAATAAV